MVVRRKRIFKKGNGKRSYVTKTQVTKMLRNYLEPKYHDYTFDNIGVLPNMPCTDIAAVPQGDGVTARNGDKIKLLSLTGQFNFFAGDSSFATLRMVAFAWRPDSDPDLPTQAEIFQNVNALISTYLNPLSSLNHRNIRSRKIVVLSDKLMHIDTAGGQVRTFRLRHTFRKKHIITYAGAFLTGQYKIYIIFLSEGGVLTPPGIRGYTRLNFTDV